MNEGIRPESRGFSEGEFDADALAAWRRTFRVLTWAFVFFLPVRVPGLRVLPDLVGWLIVVLALNHLQRPPARRWRVLALLALMLIVARIVASRLTDSPSAFLLLYTGALAVGLAFVWQLCNAIAGLAGEAGYDGLAARARLGRWLFLLHVALIYISLLVMHLTGGNVWGVAGALVTLFLNALILSAMMSLTVSAARACKLELASEPAEGPGGGPTEQPR
ncbi:MAG: hypothetical protein PVJ27_07365 [Candidatus Brocadiaceae bacterium]|jgi:hypothetical protein